MSVVAKDKVVLLTYVCTDESGEVVDSSGSEVFAYLHGHGGTVKGLEDHLDGKQVQEGFDVTLTPEEAYGERKDGWPQAVPKREFPKKMQIRKGMPFRAPGSDGNSAVLWVTDIRGSRVFVDANHPLAGKTLRFTGEIQGLREPTASELEHGHAHGAHGHRHEH